ncbi:hypothetical protein BDW59DRAFT_163271 [Aspergillus cavernicola]|uniref:Uncharacterized protein n=1 Tax=Aspergillus cavernicola TaxID=176166 RepID=A0ABR4I6V9_9EURO
MSNSTSVEGLTVQAVTGVVGSPCLWLLVGATGLCAWSRAVVFVYRENRGADFDYHIPAQEKKPPAGMEG